MLLVIAAILFILWIFGFIGHIGGGFIHILLIIAIVCIIYHFIKKS